MQCRGRVCRLFRSLAMLISTLAHGQAVLSFPHRIKEERSR
jgi:hypothetical protein